MKNKFLADPFLFGVSSTVSVFLLVEAMAMSLHGNLLAAMIFLAVGVLFLGVAIINGSIITVEKDKITQTFAFIRVRSLTWKQVEEVGVCGTKAFNWTNKNKTGTLYIYISPVKLDNDSRFEMILKWPIKNGIYLRHSSQRLIAVQYRWSGKITLYNTGSFKIEEQKMN